MGTRLELHDDLLNIVANVYYQPPTSTKLIYPCIVYNRSGKNNTHANDDLYLSNQEYQLTVIDRNPDSIIADLVQSRFDYSAITQYYTVDNLNHTTLNLTY